MTVWEALPLPCPVLSRPQAQRRERPQPSANIRRGCSARAPTTCITTLVSGLPLPLDCGRLRVRNGEQHSASTRNTSVTPGKWLSARRDGVRWGEMCLCRFLEGRRLPCPTTDFQTPPHPPPDLSFPTQQSPGNPRAAPSTHGLLGMPPSLPPRSGLLGAGRQRAFGSLVWGHLCRCPVSQGTKW